MKKGIVITVGILVFLILILAGGAADSINRGAGFLIIPSFTPSETNTLIPSSTFTSTPTEKPTATVTLTASPTIEPTATDTSAPTNTLIPTDTPTLTDTPALTDTPIPTSTPTMTDTPAPTSTPTLTDTPVPTDTPTPTNTCTPLPTFDETAFAKDFFTNITATADAYLLQQTPSITPTLQDHDLYTGLRMLNQIDGKEMVFIKNTNGKGMYGLWFDWSEVSNMEFRFCVQAGACSQPMSARCAGEKQYFEDEAYNDYPVVNITRKQAADYCDWAGMHLMSLSDWDLASETLDDNDNNYGRKYNQPLKNSMDNPFLIGNVWEWTMDYDKFENGIIAGGSWKTSAQDIRGKRIGKLPQDQFAEDLGFRCVLYVQ